MRVCHLILAGLFLVCSVPLSVADDSGYPPAGETIVYKGVTLVGTTYKFRNSEKFFSYMKTAIDMVETLPDVDWNHTGLIKKVVYDPPSKQRKSSAALPGRLGYYWAKDAAVFPAPVFYFGSVRMVAGIDLALMLVEQGRVAAKHERLLRNLKLLQEMDTGVIPRDPEKLRAIAKDNKELGHLFAAKPGDPALEAENCEGGNAIYRAHEIMFPDEQRLRSLREYLVSAGCR